MEKENQIEKTENIEEKTNNTELTNHFIDNLTLELLINKNHYKKYLSQKDPEKYKEYQEYYSKLKLYQDDIVQITMNLIENPKKQYSRDISELFEQYSKMCIRYLEMKEIENQKHDGFEKITEEDEVLFESMEDTNLPEPSKSLWGEPIVKKNNINAFSMDLFMNQQKYNTR